MFTAVKVLFITTQMKPTASQFISFLKLNAVYIFIAGANSIKICIAALIRDQEDRRKAAEMSFWSRPATGPPDCKAFVGTSAKGHFRSSPNS